jgi:MerR family transcriptional regulator, redox-sensitive transcriptional activator SoxR
MPGLTIGAVARNSGFRASAIRYYERLGILPPAERVSGQRRYSEGVLDRLAVVQFARLTGFTLVEIQQLFHGFKEGTPASTRWQKLARRKLVEVEDLIARAERIKQLLEAGLECRCYSLEECGRTMRSQKS